MATTLAGVWRGGRILQTLKDATHRALPIRPRLSEKMDYFKLGKKVTGRDDSSRDEKDNQ